MRRTLGIVGGLALGLAFSQFPEYAQQYEQRLGGAVDELRIIVADLDRDAEKFGLTREEAIQRYEVSPDTFLVARGVSMERTLARYEYLSKTLADLQSAGPIERLQHLPDYLDSEIGARAWQAYKPAVPVTPEGIMWGLGGLLLGYIALYPILGFLTLPFRWRNGKLPHRKVLLFQRRPREVIETVPASPRELARREIAAGGAGAITTPRERI